MSSRIIDDPTLLNELVHRFVFGGSVEPTTDYEISQAVESGRGVCTLCVPHETRHDYVWNGTTHEIVTYRLESDKRMSAIGHRIYDDRHGKSYQADIEAHVAAYRGHIPDYVGDAAWLAKGIEIIAKSGKDVWFAWTLGNRFAARYEDVDGKHAFIADDLSIAFWNAAIRACGWSEDAHLNVSVRPANDN